VEEFFAKVWDEAKKQLEHRQGDEEKVTEASTADQEDRGRAAGGMKKVLEKSLETAMSSWDLKETESATADEATKQMKEVLKKALETRKKS